MPKSSNTKAYILYINQNTCDFVCYEVGIGDNSDISAICNDLVPGIPKIYVIKVMLL